MKTKSGWCDKDEKYSSEEEFWMEMLVALEITTVHLRYQIDEV